MGIEEQLHAMEDVPRLLLESIDSQRQERIAPRSGLVEACPHQELSEDLDRGCLSFDKAWSLVDSVLRTLASSADPLLALAIRGGQDLGPSIGYDHPQVLLPPRVKAVSGVLSGTADWRFSDDARVTPAG